MVARNLLDAQRYWRAKLQLVNKRILIYASDNRPCKQTTIKSLYRLMMLTAFTSHYLCLSTPQSFLTWGFPQTNFSTSFSSFSPSMNLILSALINVIEGPNIATRFWYALYAGYLELEILSVKIVEEMNKAESARAGSRWPRYGRKAVLRLPRKSRWKSYNRRKLGGEAERIGMSVIIHCKSKLLLTRF